MFGKIGKAFFAVIVCGLLAIGVLGLSLMPVGSAVTGVTVAQAVGPAIDPMGSPLPTPKPGRGCTAPNGANIRKGPGQRFRIVGAIPAGGAFKIKARARGWVYGTSSYGRGWVSRGLLSCN